MGFEVFQPQSINGSGEAVETIQGIKIEAQLTLLKKLGKILQ